VSAALISLVQLGRLSAWVAVVVIAREFAVSGLRLVALAENKVISASGWGRAKTVSQIIAIIAIMVGIPFAIFGKSLGWIFMLIAIILTIVSGVDYFIKSWKILNNQALHNPEARNDDRKATSTA
jgi:CDP-diacylglycerol--glycerol-3-phosphate 3-phosphatidyltransferase